MLPYQAMLPGGVAWLGADRWSICAELGDIAYLLSTEAEQMEILNRWARWLNQFGGGISVQINIVNVLLDADTFGRVARMKLHGDKFDELRSDFNEHITSKLAATRGNVLTRRFLTLTLDGESDPEVAQERLSRAVTESSNRLRQLVPHGGCTVRLLDRAERLTLLATMTRRGEPFYWDDLDENAPSTRDAIAPWSVEDRGSHLVITAGGRETLHTTIWLRTVPPYLSDRVMSSLTEIRGDLNVTIHLDPYGAADGLDLVRGQIANLEMQYISERKKVAKQGLDADQIPHGLQSAREEAKQLRADLEGSNQRLWSTLCLIGISADSKDELDRLVEQVTTALRGHSCTGEIATAMLLDGYRSELPLGARCLPMQRTLTTSAAAVLHPFTSQERMDARGRWYGCNGRSGNPLIVAREEAINGNGFVLGTTGSGKSHASKSELLGVFLNTDDDVIVIDPEREYQKITERVGGQRVVVDAAGTSHINALEVDLEGRADDPILAKAQFVLGLCGGLIGGIDGLQPTDRSVIDRSTTEILRVWAADTSAPRPTLRTLRDHLHEHGGREGVEIARALDLYTTGSLDAFAQQTNVNLNSRFLCYDIADLSNELKNLGMMIILDQIWTRVTANRAEGKRTWLYVDEFHMLFQNPYTAEYFLTFFKRARKWGLMITGITQNIEELLRNDSARLMLANSDFLLLLNQSPTDADALRDLLRMSEEQRDCFAGVDQGSGLLKSGAAYIPFDNAMDPEKELNTLLSTQLTKHTAA